MPTSDISYDISLEFEDSYHDELRILAFRSSGLAWLRDDDPIRQIFWSRRGQARAIVFAEGGARARLRADEAARGALGRSLPGQCGHRVPYAATARGRRSDHFRIA